MARKGVLASNPDVKNMTSTQWLMEFHALQLKEKTWFDAGLKAFRDTLITVLGLNSIRPEDEEGKPKAYEQMDDEEKESYLPFIAWVGRPELLKIVKDQMDSDIGMSANTPADKAYEELAAQIDAAGGDMEPILGKMHGVDYSQVQETVEDNHQKEQLERAGVKVAPMKIEVDKY